MAAARQGFRHAPLAAASPVLTVGHRAMLGGALGAVFVERWLGGGGHGEVYAVRLEGRPGLWALKVTDLQTLSRAELLRAAYLQRRCAGPDVVAGHTPLFLGNRGYTLLERAFGPSLDVWLETHAAHNRLALPLALAYFAQMVHAVRRCHAAGVVHQDVKPDNFLLVKDAPIDPQGPPVQLKLGDFDTARELGGHAARGTATYLAPEALLGAPAGPAADAWALGTSLFRLLVGIEPYYDDQEAQILRRLQRGEPAYDLADLQAVLHGDGLGFGVRAEVVTLVRALLHPDPSQRPGVDQLLTASVLRLARR